MSETEMLNSDLEIINKDELNDSSEENTISKDTQTTSPDYVYVISVNDCPKGYVHSEEQAKELIIKKLRTSVRNDYLDVSYHVEQVSENEFHLTASYNWYVVSYERVVLKVKYDKLPLIPMTRDDFQSEETSSDSSETSSSSSDDETGEN